MSRGKFSNNITNGMLNLEQIDILGHLDLDQKPNGMFQTFDQLSNILQHILVLNDLFPFKQIEQNIQQAILIRIPALPSFQIRPILITFQ
jgi:hypothetical protein